MGLKSCTKSLEKSQVFTKSQIRYNWLCCVVREIYIRKVLRLTQRTLDEVHTVLIAEKFRLNINDRSVGGV
jgi:hypothetical protein